MSLNIDVYWWCLQLKALEHCYLVQHFTFLVIFGLVHIKTDQNVVLIKIVCWLQSAPLPPFPALSFLCSKSALSNTQFSLPPTLTTAVLVPGTALYWAAWADWSAVWLKLRRHWRKWCDVCINGKCFCVAYFLQLSAAGILFFISMVAP